MRFALVGNQIDGVEMATALVASGRHSLAAYTAPVDEESVRAWGEQAQKVSDVEEVLADPAIEAVLVAGGPGRRAAQLRRALQSERHVLGVHPADATPEIAYEAAMIRDDTGCVLLPLLPEALHPAIERLAAFVQGPGRDGEVDTGIGSFRLLEVQRAATGEVLEGWDEAGQKPSFPGWDVLRRLGGEIQELFAFADRDELAPDEPILLAGRFEQGGVFQMTLLPNRSEACYHLAVVGTRGRAELLFPLGWRGPAILEFPDPEGKGREEYWEPWDPWPALLEQFEIAVGLRAAGSSAPRLSWHDALRALELDDAARRSLERRRASTLEYPEATEETGFKGTMTLLGCGLVWAVLMLLILSSWKPWLGWLIVPLLALFLVLQLLRYLIPGPRGPG